MSEREKSKEQEAKTITDKIQEASAQLHKIFEPQWGARNDVLKTIVSLSSGSIILSVTFSSSLRPLNLDRFWRYLIVFSFALFIASLIIALLGLWTSTRLYEAQANVFSKRMDTQKKFMDSTSTEEFLKGLDGIIESSYGSIEASDKLTAKLFHASSICFGLAVIALAAVGIAQLLS
jgi:hypothetical protein